MKKSLIIKVFITGGTIDDLEYESPKDAPKDPQSFIPEKLKQARLSIVYSTEVLFMKDSRHVTDDDRKMIAEKCKQVAEQKIIITHGTYTIPKTAKVLGEQNIDKTIVLVGAAIPINKLGSDGLFNLGAAVVAVQQLETGVYVAMNGKVFTWDNVKKNFDTGMFEQEKI